MEPTNLHRIFITEDVNGGPATGGRFTGTDQRPLVGMRTGSFYLDGQKKGTRRRRVLGRTLRSLTGGRTWTSA